jgi:hypothetical protein
MPTTGIRWVCCALHGIGCRRRPRRCCTTRRLRCSSVSLNASTAAALAACGSGASTNPRKCWRIMATRQVRNVRGRGPLVLHGVTFLRRAPRLRCLRSRCCRPPTVAAGHERRPRRKPAGARKSVHYFAEGRLTGCPSVLGLLGLGGLRSSGVPLAQGADQFILQVHSLSECRITAASAAMASTTAPTIASKCSRVGYFHSPAVVM